MNDDTDVPSIVARRRRIESSFAAQTQSAPGLCELQ